MNYLLTWLARALLEDINPRPLFLMDLPASVGTATISGLVFPSMALALG